MACLRILIPILFTLSILSCKKPCPAQEPWQFVPLDSVFKALITNNGLDTLTFTYNSLDTVKFYLESRTEEIFKYQDNFINERCGYYGGRYWGEQVSNIYISPDFAYKLILIFHQDKYRPRIECYLGYDSWDFDVDPTWFRNEVILNGITYSNAYIIDYFVIDLYKGIVSFKAKQNLWQRIL